jgi:UrcA family protein
MNASAPHARTSALRSIARPGMTLILCVLTSTALAGPPPEVSETAFTVKFQDLDLGTRTGAHTLYRRIKNAAESLCGLADRIDVLRHADFARCANQAVASAIRGLARPELTKVYLATLTPQAAATFEAYQAVPLAVSR